ncbi:hypothetical protein NU08_1385 [Flavobacterium anhuiense]|uniref:Uncharacterized protein n=1 Tax=Flavobacterium anhuiense TaxID=459526 RepID=A0A444W1Y4_9FLAO|nr:hypothetical protein NU08_1385 [Flavobacterium anhuiense]
MIAMKRGLYLALNFNKNLFFKKRDFLHKSLFLVLYNIL